MARPCLPHGLIDPKRGLNHVDNGVGINMRQVLPFIKRRCDTACAIFSPLIFCRRHGRSGTPPAPGKPGSCSSLLFRERFHTFVRNLASIAG